MVYLFQVLIYVAILIVLIMNYVQDGNFYNIKYYNFKLKF